MAGIRTIRKRSKARQKWIAYKEGKLELFLTGLEVFNGVTESRMQRVLDAATRQLAANSRAT